MCFLPKPDCDLCARHIARTRLVRYDGLGNREINKELYICFRCEQKLDNLIKQMREDNFMREGRHCTDVSDPR